MTLMAAALANRAAQEQLVCWLQRTRGRSEGRQRNATRNRRKPLRGRPVSQSGSQQAGCGGGGAESQRASERGKERVPPCSAAPSRAMRLLVGSPRRQQHADLIAVARGGRKASR